MSPKIWRNGDLIADVIDETGTHEMLDGKPIYINVDGIDAQKRKQLIIIEAEELGGRREFGLTLEGIGKSWDLKRGDGKQPELGIVLNDRPIRVTYSASLGWEDDGDVYSLEPLPPPRRALRETRLNPRWIRNPERR